MDDTFSSGDIAAASSAASGASPAPAPSGVDQSAASASTDATVPSASGSTPESQPSTPTGVPPEQRWPSILENARKEAADKARAEWKQQYGWAETVDQRAVAEAMRIGQLFAQDRAGYIRQLLSEAVTDPQLAPVVRSEAARLLAQGHSKSEIDLSPIAVQLENGQQLGMFSDQQVSALIQRALADQEQKLDEKYKPALSAAQRLEQAEREQSAKVFAHTVDQELQRLPGMDPEKNKENRVAVAERLKQYLAHVPDERADDPILLESLTRRSWMDVVLPKLQASDRQSVLNDINQKAAVSSVNPASGPSAPPNSLKDMSWQDALESEAKRVGLTR